MSPTLAFIGVRADLSTVLTLAVGVDILTNLEFIIVVAAVVVAARFIVVIIAACAVEVLVPTEATISGAPVVDAEVNANCLGDTTCAFELVLPASLDELLPSCSALFSCWLMTVLDGDRPLQDSKPSCHV